MGIKQPTPSPAVGRGRAVAACVPARDPDHGEVGVTVFPLFSPGAWVMYYMIKRLLGPFCVAHQVFDPSSRNGGTGSGPLEVHLKDN